MKGDLVLIDWIDHSGGSSSWTDVDDYKDVSELEYRIKTVGFVISENRQRILVVQSWAVNDAVNHHMCLEKKLIKSITVLRKAKS